MPDSLAGSDIMWFSPSVPCPGRGVHWEGAWMSEQAHELVSPKASNDPSPLLRSPRLLFAPGLA